MHVYQMRSSNKSIVTATEQRMQTCMHALKEVSKVWLVAKMVHTLFESILGNKHLEERLQKAAGKRHQKNKNAGMMKPKEEALKRKFDEMDIGFNGPPAHQVSYERSRPQTPAMTPNDFSQQQQMPNMTATSPQLTRQNNDAFMGNSRSGTRPTSPFIPGTPPDLFLITRNSPNISQDVWQNFQPDQLFPTDANISFPLQSPVQQHNMVDPALTRGTTTQLPIHSHNNGMQPQPQQHMQNQQHLQPPQTPMSMGPGNMHDPNTWAQHMEMMGVQPSPNSVGNEDTWSNSSRGGPIVPTTLNVEDWYVAILTAPLNLTKNTNEQLEVRCAKANM